MDIFNDVFYEVAYSLHDMESKTVWNAVVLSSIPKGICRVLSAFCKISDFWSKLAFHARR